MKLAQLIAEDEKYPRRALGGVFANGGYPIAASTPTHDILDMRVFRNGIRVDGDPQPFVIYLHRNLLIRFDSVESAMESLR